VNDQLVHVLLWLAGVLFSAGGFYVYVRLSLKQLSKEAKSNHDAIVKDIDGLGGIIRTGAADAARRYHNLSMAVLIAAPLDKEPEVSKLLKEG